MFDTISLSNNRFGDMYEDNKSADMPIDDETRILLNYCTKYYPCATIPMDLSGQFGVIIPIVRLEHNRTQVYYNTHSNDTLIGFQGTNNRSFFSNSHY
jgi:hypothetical protein